MNKDYENFVKRMGSSDLDFEVDSDDILKHYGVLGMKWGRRKGSVRTVSSLLKRDKTVHQDAAKKNLLKKKKINQLSNSELKTLNERLQLEKQYKELSKTDVLRGQKFVNDVLSNAAKQTASNYTSKYMTKATEVAISKLLNL